MVLVCTWCTEPSPDHETIHSDDLGPYLDAGWCNLLDRINHRLFMKYCGISDVGECICLVKKLESS